MKKYLVLCYLIYSCSQNSDMLIETKELNIASSLISEGKFISATHLLRDYLKKEQHSPELNAKVYYKIGAAYQNCTLMDSAVYYYKKANEITKTFPNNSLLFLQYHYKASVYFNKQETDSSVYYALKCLDYAKLTKNKINIIKANANLAQIFLQEENIYKAQKYIESSYTLCSKAKDSLSIINNFLLDADLNRIKNKYKFSKSKINLVLEYSKRKNLTLLEFKAQGLLTKILYLEGLFQKATSTSFKALALLNDFESCNELKAQINQTNELTSKKTKPKPNHINKDYISDLRKKIIAEETNLNFLIGSTEASDYQGSTIDFKILKSTNSLITLKDSLYQYTLKSKYLEFETKYQAEKKEKENLQLKAEKIQQELVIAQNQKQKYTFGTIAILLASGFIGFFFFAKRKRENLIRNTQLTVAKAKQEQNNLLADDLHDTKAKELQGIEKLLETKGLFDISSKVNDIRTSIREISHKLTRISFEKSEFNEQIKSLFSTYYNDDFLIIENGLDEIDWSTILDVVKENLFIAIREALSNADDYSNATEFKITFKKERKHLNVSIYDNGKGLSKDFATGKGLTNMKLRINEINGKMNFKSIPQKGFSLNFDILLT